MDTRDETLIRLSGEQIILRAAVKWLLAREAKRSGNIDIALQEASRSIEKVIEAMRTSDSFKGPIQEGADQLIAQARLEAHE